MVGSTPSSISVEVLLQGLLEALTPASVGEQSKLLRLVMQYASFSLSIYLEIYCLLL